MKINICFFCYFLNSCSIDYIISETCMMHNSIIQNFNTENAYLENNIIVNNILCSPSEEYDNLSFFIFNPPVIENPSFFLVIDNNQLYKKSNLDKKYDKSNLLNNDLTVNTVLSNSINSNISNLTISGNTIHCGNSKSELSLTGSLITLNSPAIYTNKFNTNIRTSDDIIFEKSLEVKSKFFINDIQASAITINDEMPNSSKNVSFSNTVNLTCDDFTIAGSVIFNNDLIINSNNCFLFTTNLISPINFLIIDNENKVFQSTKIPISETNYFIDNLIPINPESRDIIINSQNNEFIMAGDGIFYSPNKFTCYNLDIVSINNLEVKDSYIPIFPTFLTINQNMNIKNLTPKGYNNTSLTDQNYINILNFNIPIILLSRIFSNLYSDINSQCIFQNINITDYSLGYIVWNTYYTPEDVRPTNLDAPLKPDILYYASWNDVIVDNITNLLEYIDYKKNQNIEDKKTYIDVLIKKIYNLLHLIKNNINKDPVNLKIQLNKIMEQI